MSVRCSRCGSEDVQYAVWFNPNTEEVGEIFGSWGEEDSSFCCSCEENGTLVETSEEEVR